MVIEMLIECLDHGLDDFSGLLTPVRTRSLKVALRALLPPRLVVLTFTVGRGVHCSTHSLEWLLP